MNVRSSFVFAVAGALVLTAASGQDPQPQQDGIPECQEMKTTESGLKWGILSPGREEEKPTRADQVEVHYTGWLTDGTKFDSSRDRGQTATFGVTQVIKGWTEGLQLMTPGMRCKFEIPGDLAYGPQGRPPKIPGNATLVFDVELVRVVRMPKMRAANTDKQKTLDNGIKVEIVKVGTGAQVAPEDGRSFRFAMWRADGDLIVCTETNRGQNLGGLLNELPVPFMKDVVGECKVGEIVRCEVPQSVYGNYRTDTVWEFELVSTAKVPAFRMLDKEKAVTTQTGLKYEVLDAGEGTAPKATDTVLAHYTGWLTDGTMFDSSHKRGEPTEFPLNGVIPGWTEGVQLMKPGAKFLFEIPSELGYGAQPSGAIPANSTLVFLVELVKVK